MNRVRIGIIICVVILVCSSCNNKKNTKEKEPKTIGTTIDVAKIIGTDQMQGYWGRMQLVYNPNDINQLVYSQQYVFVGRVEEYIGAKYTGEHRENVKSIYSVKVLENLKGELITSDNIMLETMGGLVKDTDMFVVYEDFALPAVGETYVFSAYNDEGDLLCHSAYVGSDYKNGNVYKEFVDACDNPMTFDFKTSEEILKELNYPILSRYDVHYNNEK